MPRSSFLVIDKSILEAFWSKDYDNYKLAQKLRLFVIWRNKHNSLVLNQDWDDFKKEVRKKLEDAPTGGEETDFEKEMFEHIKSFVDTQKFFKENSEKSARENLIILTKAIPELGNVIVITNINDDTDFNSKIGKSQVHNLSKFIKIVEIKYPEFSECFEKYYRSS